MLNDIYRSLSHQSPCCVCYINVLHLSETSMIALQVFALLQPLCSSISRHSAAIIRVRGTRPPPPSKGLPASRSVFDSRSTLIPQ